jgi:hypothetical protein
MAYIGKNPASAALTSSDITDGIISLPKLTDGTDGNIISYDASGNPVAVATGTDGQVLTSTGAGSPPVFETPASATNTPAFHVFESSSQTVTTNTYTKCTLDEELYDTNSDFASSRFTPTVAGKYFIYGNIHLDGSSYPTHLETSIYKNGSIIATNFTGESGAYVYGNKLVQTTVDMNGSSDYVELYGKVTQGGTCSFVGGVQNKFFGGYRILT